MQTQQNYIYIKYALYPKIKSDLVEYMSENSHALANGGSSDCAPSKMNLVCVYILDAKNK